MNEEDLKIPANTADHAQSHAQVMFAIGMLTGELKGMKGEMQGLKDAKVIQNGRVDKLEIRTSATELAQAQNEGRSEGVSASWAIFIAVSGLLIGALGVWASIHFIHG